MFTDLCATTNKALGNVFEGALWLTLKEMKLSTTPPPRSHLLTLIWPAHPPAAPAFIPFILLTSLEKWGASFPSSMVSLDTLSSLAFPLCSNSLR